MGTVTRLVGLVPAAALALACASPVSRVELLPAAAERPLEKIVLLPLDLPSGGRVSSARDAVGPDASEVVTGRVLEALVESGRFRVIPPGDVRVALAGLAPNAPVQDVREQLVRSFGPDALLRGRVRRYDGRGSGGQPAAVSFDLELRAADGTLLWTGSYDETQRGLSEDPGSFARVSARGFRFVDAEALAGFGARELVRQLPGNAVAGR